MEVMLRPPQHITEMCTWCQFAPLLGLPFWSLGYGGICQVTAFPFVIKYLLGRYFVTTDMFCLYQDGLRFSRLYWVTVLIYHDDQSEHSFKLTSVSFWYTPFFFSTSVLSGTIRCPRFISCLPSSCPGPDHFFKNLI